MQYTYQCKMCEEVFERSLSVADRKIPESEHCPNNDCGAMEVRQIITSGPSIGYTYQTSKVRTTDSFNDRMKEIKKKLPSKYQGNINAIIR